LLIIWDNYWRHLWEKKRILAIDPGFRSGCKIVCLDERRFAVQRDHLSTRPKKEAMAMKKIRSMVNSYRIDAISIGNGLLQGNGVLLRKLL
jgi:uncharacterized protein